MVAGIALSVQEITTCLESDPGGGEIFHVCPDRTRGPTIIPYKGYWVFIGHKLRGMLR